jgi:hypothetical protein
MSPQLFYYPTPFVLRGENIKYFYIPEPYGNQGAKFNFFTFLFLVNFKLMNSDQVEKQTFFLSSN